MKKLIYISGKISGIEDSAPAIFKRAEDALVALGFNCVNPIRLPHNPESTWADFMRKDVAALMECDSIFMLSNWEDSAGAVLEHLLATAIGLQIFYQPNTQIMPLSIEQLNQLASAPDKLKIQGFDDLKQGRFQTRVLQLMQLYKNGNIDLIVVKKPIRWDQQKKANPGDVCLVYKKGEHGFWIKKNGVNLFVLREECYEPSQLIDILNNG